MAATGLVSQASNSNGSYITYHSHEATGRPLVLASSVVQQGRMRPLNALIKPPPAVGGEKISLTAFAALPPFRAASDIGRGADDADRSNDFSEREPCGSPTGSGGSGPYCQFLIIGNAWLVREVRPTPVVSPPLLSDWYVCEPPGSCGCLVSLALRPGLHMLTSTSYSNSSWFRYSRQNIPSLDHQTPPHVERDSYCCAISCWYLAVYTQHLKPDSEHSPVLVRLGNYTESAIMADDVSLALLLH